MELLSWLALIFLTLFGYSAGAVFGGRMNRRSRGADPSPSLLDTFMVPGLWIGAIVSRLTILGRWTALFVWFLAALGTAFVLSLVQTQTDDDKAITQ